MVNENKISGTGLDYKYLFIDEFQDTDDVQIETILGLQKIFGDQCRLFIVGDLKQSIYRFRGATLSAFTKVENENLDWAKYSLNRNYRTDGRLLDLFDSAFSDMGDQDLLPYKEIDKLTSRIQKEYSDDQLVRKIETKSKDKEQFFEDLFKEVEYQKQEIEALTKTKKLSKEEKTIAILVRYNYQIANIVKASESTDLSIKISEGGDLFRLTSTVDLYKLVLAVTHPYNKVYLVNLIESNYMSVKIQQAKLRGHSSIDKVSELVRILDEYFMLLIGKKWNELIIDFETRPVLVVLRDIYEHAKPWIKYSSKQDYQLEYRTNYECLLEKILDKTRLFIDKETTIKGIAKRLKRLKNRIDEITENEEKNRVFQRIEYFDVSIPEIDKLIDALNELNEITKYFYDDFNDAKNDFKSFYKKIGDVLIKKVLNVEEIDSGFKEIVKRVLKRLDEVKDVEANASFDCLKETMQLYLQQIPGENRGANWIVRNFEQIDGDVLRKNRSRIAKTYHFACLSDVDMSITHKDEFSWPLDINFFEVAQAPVDWKYQVFVTSRLEYKNFRRYALVYGLAFSKCAIKLSYIKNEIDGESELYYLLRILNAKISLIFANRNKDQATRLKYYFDRCGNQHLNAVWATEKLYIPGNTKEQFSNILEENLSLVYDSAKLQEYEEWVI